MRKSLNILLFGLMLVCSNMNAADIKINSLKELDYYATQSGNVISMSPGIYPLTDYLPADSMIGRRNRRIFQFFTFSGNNNVFKMEGVEIEIDTELRNFLNPPKHTSEFLMTGSGNTLSGLEIRHFGTGTSLGGAAFQIAGDGNVLRNITLRVTGSSPYGYGDYFGKGAPGGVIPHRKKSGLLITGDNIKLYGCKLYMRSFGHGYFVQGGENIYFEDCYVEGEVRKTDDMLAETSGPAFDVNFRTWTINREGEYHITPGYTKSLCEDGFRTYSHKNIHFKNCTAKNTRGGFELRTRGGIRLENCTTIGTERAYWFGNGAVVKNCKGDASYGPLAFIEGSNVDVELILVPTESNSLVHALVTIQGENNNVVLKSLNGKLKTKELPILIGYTPPEHGESMSPFGEAEATGLKFRNETGMPVIFGEKASNCEIVTNGSVLENKGRNISIIKK